MNENKARQLLDLCEKYEYKPEQIHLDNLTNFLSENAYQVADICKAAIAALTAKPVKLLESFYGVIQDGKVVMISADDGQWLNKTTVEEGFRALEQAKVSAEHERDCHMDIADYFKESWVTQKQRAEAAEEWVKVAERTMDHQANVITELGVRAEAAEAKLATKEEELSQYVECFEAEAARADRNHAKLAELEQQEPVIEVIVDGRATDDYMFNINKPLPNGIHELFTRPAPAINLAELVPSNDLLRVLDFAKFVIKCVRKNREYAPLSSQEPDEIDAIIRNIEEAK